METCSHCGASLSPEDALCPACGTERAAGGAADAGEAVLVDDEGQAVETGAELVEGAASQVESAEGEAVEAPSVPAGTWASTSESEVPAAPPETRPFEREPDTRRVRRVREEDEVRTEARSVRGRVRADAVARGRARGLAVAPAPTTAEETEAEEAERPGARVVAFPGRGSATASSSGMRPNAPAEAPHPPAPPPKWLASELLRDPTPAEPYGWPARVLATAGGIAGTAASLVIGHGGPDLGMAALFVSLAVLAIVPVGFAIRSGGFAVIASIGLAVATWTRIGGAEGEAIGLATMGTTLLAAAQLLRSVQRRSKFAKAAMMVGIAATAMWLVLDGGLGAMVVRSESLDAWLGPLVRALLMIVLALSLLGFLDDSGTSGTRVWPWLVLGWSALEGAATIALVGTDTTLATAATPVFSAVAALGWMQVWATTPGLGARETVRSRGDG